MEDTNTEALKTWPERIYLQHECDDIPSYNEVNPDGAVTWHTDSINKLDIEYVRADLVALSSSVTANANMQATSAELDAWIVETVKKANLLCVHPEADTTIDIGRAIVAALSSPATGINMRANEPNVRLDPLLRHPGGYPLDQEDLAWRLWQARTTSSQPPAAGCAEDTKTALCSAALSCWHRVDSELVILGRDNSKPGNALAQLVDRLLGTHLSLIAAPSPADQANDVTQRKAYICANCKHPYPDEPVSQCDCTSGKKEWIEGVITYPATTAAEQKTEGGEK